jgi:hypothetical protein
LYIYIYIMECWLFKVSFHNNVFQVYAVGIWNCVWTYGTIFTRYFSFRAWIKFYINDYKLAMTVKEFNENMLIPHSFICFLLYGLWCLTQLSTIFQLYRGGFSVINKHPVNLNDTDLRWTCAYMHHMSINKIVQSLSICGISALSSQDIFHFVHE